MPAPDLAIEIDITSSSIPRLPIYASFGVPEVWRYDGTALIFYHLHRKSYRPAKAQQLLPHLFSQAISLPGYSWVRSQPMEQC
jgi:Uma2 family endonuclease